ncbi:MAG: hypothetical protein ACKVRO_02580 [Micropepsaceae bacterium]
MHRHTVTAILFTSSFAAAVAWARPATDEEIEAAERAPLPQSAIDGDWNTPYEPFQAIGNVYYVGTKGISSWLITTPSGHILIDGIMPQSAPP